MVSKGRRELPDVGTTFLILIGVVLTQMHTIKIFAKVYTYDYVYLIFLKWIKLGVPIWFIYQ